MATFNSFDLGPVTTVALVPNPLRWQINTYPGVNGRERLNLGTDGGRVIVDGISYGATQSLLTSWWSTIYFWQRTGLVASIVDNEAVTIPQCVLVFIEPTDRIQRAADGGYARKYRLTFEYDNEPEESSYEAFSSFSTFADPGSLLVAPPPPDPGIVSPPFP